MDGERALDSGVGHKKVASVWFCFIAAFYMPATPGPAPDSPRSSQSPPPSGTQGDLELELLGLANALYNLGTTVINDSTKERDKPGGGKQVGLRVNEVNITVTDAQIPEERPMLQEQEQTEEMARRQEQQA